MNYASNNITDNDLNSESPNSIFNFNIIDNLRLVIDESGIDLDLFLTQINLEENFFKFIF